MVRVPFTRQGVGHGVLLDHGGQQHPPPLASTETGYLEPRVELVVSQDAFVALGTVNSITVPGVIAVTGNNSKAQCIAANGNRATITIGAQASLTAPGDTLFNFSGVLCRFTNACLLGGGTDGIISDSLANPDFHLPNTGTIPGQRFGICLGKMIEATILKDGFLFRRQAGFDTIADFENGVDKIELTPFGIRPADFASIVASALRMPEAPRCWISPQLAAREADPRPGLCAG